MKDICIIRIEERFNYGDDFTYYYAESYEKALEWIEKNYENVEEDEDGRYVDKEADIIISIETAFYID